MDSAQPAQAEAPHYNGMIFFIPVSNLAEMFAGQTGLEKAFNEMRDKYPRMPTWKSIKTWIFESKVAYPTRPTSLASLHVFNTALVDLPQDTADRPILWRPHSEWRGFLLGLPFRHEATRKIWLDRLEREYELAVRVFGDKKDQLSRLKLVAQDPLVEELGACGARMRMDALVASEDPSICDSPEIGFARMADGVSTAVRFIAWLVVDRSLARWEEMVAAGKEEDVLFQELLPELDAQSVAWSRPLQRQLQVLSRDAGCPPYRSATSFLGSLWGNSLNACIKGRQKLLRNWEEERPVRPSKSSVNGLLASLGAFFGTGVIRADYHSERFRFAWAAGHLRQLLSDNGMPDAMVADVVAVYEQEYRLARRILGRPLSSDSTEQDSAGQSAWPASESSC